MAETTRGTGSGQSGRDRPVGDPEVVQRRLAEHALRVTPQRLVTWRAIAEVSPHATIHDVYEHVHERLPTTTLRTVYETVHVLQQIGLVRLLHLPGGARVEVEPVDHAHGYCERCGRVVNLPRRPAMTTDAASGFQVRFEEDIAFGLCDRCAGVDAGA